MNCPICGTWCIVKETRTSTQNTRRRRLECANQHRFSTIETIIEQDEPKNKLPKKQILPKPKIAKVGNGIKLPKLRNDTDPSGA